VKPAKAVRMRCPQCRGVVVVRGRTARDAVLGEHLAAQTPRLVGEGDAARQRWTPAAPRPCRFVGATLADTRQGITASARAMIERRRQLAEAVKEVEASPAKIELSAQFGHVRGLVDAEEETDDEHAARVATAFIGSGAATGAPRDATAVVGDTWVARECVWTGWECDCIRIKNHVRTPLDPYRIVAGEPGDGPQVRRMTRKRPRHPDTGFRIMISADVEVGYGAGVETVWTECPTWRPVRRSAVLNPHRGLSGTDSTGSSRRGGMEKRSEAKVPVRVLAVETITSPRHLSGGPAGLWPHAARVVRSAWTLDQKATEADHVTVGVVGFGERDGAPVRWWAYWSGPIKDGKDSMRFAGGFWAGWPVKVGQLNDLISGRLAEPPKERKVRKAPTKKAVSARRKDWVES